MQVKFTYEGQNHQIDVEDNQTILQAGLQADIDLPYSCEAGVCGECKSRLLSGDVDMEADDGLEEDEINQGFILTCQALLKEDSIIEYQDNGL
ncbi:MAG: hypothetical protein IEMM0008_1724 [bacterium]|nr:MAG: hypothetical protein IEMM0008_1724 [bacterium]